MNNPNYMINETSLSLRELSYLLFKHKKKIIIIFVIMTLVFTTYVVTRPDFYTSNAELLVKAGRENVEMIPSAENAMSISRELDINTEIEILKSKDVLKEVVNDLGIEQFVTTEESRKKIENDPSLKIQFTDSIVNYLQGTLEVINKKNTNVIQISFSSLNPEMAYGVLSSLIDAYMKKRVNIHYSDNSFNFFNKQFEDTRHKLSDIDNKLVQLKNELNISSVSDYRDSIISRIKSIQAEIDNNATARAESESRIKTLKEMLTDLPATIDTEIISGSETTLNQLYLLQLKEQELLSKYSEDNVQVKEIRRQIAEAEKLLKDQSQVNKGVNTTYQNLQQDFITEQTNFQSLKARDIILRKVLAETRNDLSELNTAGLEIERLERERQSLLESYNRYSESLEEAKIDKIVQEQNISNIRVIQAATLPLRPEQTRKYRNVAMGLFVGLFGGIGIALFIEYFDHSLKKPQDVIKWLELRPLVSIPDYTKSK